MFAGGDEKRQLRGFGDELDAASEEELRRRPEVRIINKFALGMAYIRTGLKGVGALALLWATVVLLGGFVSDLRSIDFWYLTTIAFVQAAGLSDAMGDSRLLFFGGWLGSLMRNITSWGDKHHDERTQLSMEQWLGRQINILLSKIMDITLFLTFLPVACFAAYGPILCFLLSLLRLRKQDYGIADGDASKANLNPGLTLFYCLSLAQSAVSFLSMIIEMSAQEHFLRLLSPQHGFSAKVILAYWDKTKHMCLNNPASMMSWNLVAYGADLLDSQTPEDYVSGGRVLSMLIDQNTPLAITWLLIRSPRQRIQKLIGTLAWRSPAEQEMRCLAARIVEHLAGHLNLSHFPGALECISSLFHTSFHTNADQEALHLTFVTDRIKQRKRSGSLNQNFAGNPQKDKHCNLNFMGDSVAMSLTRSMLEGIYNKLVDEWNGRTLQQDINQRGNCEDLVLTGLRILENLAHDINNCTLIYNTKDLLSKILVPVSSNKLVEDIKSNAAWTKVVDGSLKVVRSLMGSSGSTGKKMCRLIANNINAVKNLEAILDMDMKNNNGIIELQMRAIEVLTQVVLHHQASISATKRRDKIIERALHIFLTTDWIEDYLKDEKRKLDNTSPTSSTLTYMTSVEKQAAKAHVEKRMKEAKETASRLKEKAGEALAMLSGDSEAIKSFTGCKNNEVVRLTELLNSKIKTIDCKTDAEDIGCRISAVVILRHLSNYDKEDKIRKQGTLRTVLAELLPGQASRECLERLLDICCCKSDIENPSVGRGGFKQSNSASQSHHIKQCGERRLQAELISLVAAVRPTNNCEFAEVLISQLQPDALENLGMRLKNIVEDNMYATPACLAIQKLTCKMITDILQHDDIVKVIDDHKIIDTLLEASKAMAGLESSMLFAGIDRDCHGVPLKPLSSVLAKDVEDVLAERKQAVGINIAPADA